MSTTINKIFEDKKIRIINNTNNEIWFVNKDGCDILGIKNHNDAISGLDEDEKGVGKTDTLGGVQGMSIISESGLYKLIFQSKKPNAKIFTKWVTSELLPSLRKNGQYGINKLEQTAHAIHKDIEVLSNEVNTLHLFLSAIPEYIDTMIYALEKLHY